jgi:hypothetical protein
MCAAMQRFGPCCGRENYGGATSCEGFQVLIVVKGEFEKNFDEEAVEEIHDNSVV